MLNEKVAEQSTSIDLKEVAKSIALTLGFAVAYYLMVQYSPVLAKSSLAGMMFGKTLRLANMLRAFLFVTPTAVYGTTLGSFMLNLEASPMAGLVPGVMLATGLYLRRVSKKIGRSVGKDLAILCVYGLVSALIVSIRGLIAVNALNIDGLVGDIVTYKFITSPLIYMAGYPFVRMWEHARGTASK